MFVASRTLGSGPLIHEDFRALFGADDWRALQDCAVLVCRDAPHMREDERPWEALNETLGRIAKAIALSPPDDDLALAVLADLAADDVRQRVFAHVRSRVAESPERALRAVTEQTARMVDRICPAQGFPFRSTLIVVSMLVADEIAMRA